MLEIIVTTAGRAAIVNAQATGTAAVTIAAVGVSASNFAPSAATAALPGEIKRITSIGGTAVGGTVIHVLATDSTEDGYTVRSLALYLDDGTLFGSYSQASPIVVKAGGAALFLAIDVALVDIAAASITFGDTSLVDPPASDARAGVVELATAAEVAAGTDTQRVVTPAGARQVYARLSGAAFTGTVTALDFGATAVSIVPAAGTGGMSLHFGTDPGRTGYMRFRDAAGEQIGYIGNNVFAGPLLISSPAGVDFLGGLVTVGGATIWHAGNDGAGSGLDADLLDGWHRDEIRAWGNITGKPASYPAAAHTHAFADITGKPASYPAAAHTHAFADITDKPATFPAAAHAHAFADITDKPATYPAAAHTHAFADITDKPASYPPAAHSHVANVFAERGSRVHDDGFIEMWGFGPLPENEGPLTVEFPTPFPTACLGVMTVTINVTQSNQGLATIQEVSLHPAYAELYVQNSGSYNYETGFRWRAWGH